MNILISNTSPSPIYEQIYRQLRAAILSGELQEGQLLPSIRALAKDLRVSVITTKRAYDELERDGFLHTVAGKGCYVAKTNAEQLCQEYTRELEQHLREVLRLAPLCGLSTEGLVVLLKMLEKE